MTDNRTKNELIGKAIGEAAVAGSFAAILAKLEMPVASVAWAVVGLFAAVRILALLRSAPTPPPHL